MDKMVSVIVPVYNAERFINDCISSILGQTYSNIEVIIVDDGSDDKSLELCKEWLYKDKRIILINQMNKGVSTARNVGIERAKGYYIMFVDSDDIIDKDAIETYVKLLENREEKLLFTEYRTNTGKVYGQDCASDSRRIDKSEVISYLLTPGFHGAVWSKLYNRKVIKDNDLKFNSEIRFCEDVLFNYEYAKFIDNAYYSPVKKYIYTIRDGSTMRQPVMSINDKCIDIVEVFKMIVDESEGELYYNKAVSRLVYQSCKLIPSFTAIEGGTEVIDRLRGYVYSHLFTFLADNTYPLQTRVKAIIKMTFPKSSYRIIGNVI